MNIIFSLFWIGIVGLAGLPGLPGQPGSHGIVGHTLSWEALHKISALEKDQFGRTWHLISQKSA